MNYFDILFAKTNGISSSTCYNEIEAMLKTTVGHSSKNLLPITLESGTYTSGGANLTYTVDKAAGTITLNGTSRTSGVIVLTVYEDSAGKITGNFYLSGGGNENARFTGRDLTNGTGMFAWDGVTPSAASIDENDSQQIKPIAGHDNDFRYRILEGATFNNVVLKPMLRYGSISDSAFEPYVTPTDEKKQDKPITLDSTVLTFNIAEIQGKYETLKFVIEYTMDEISTIEYNVVEVPTFIFGRGNTSYYKIFTFSAEYARDNFDAISFTESDGNVTVNPYTASSQNIIKIIGTPK